MNIPVFPLHVSFLLLILIFPLLDMWAVDMRRVKLSATWVQASGVTSWIPHLLFPNSYYLISCYQQSSYSVIVLHVSCIVLVPDILGETWRLTRSIGWISGSIVSPTAGDVVALSNICYSSLSFMFPIPLLAEGPGLSMPGVCLGQWSQVCKG